MDNLVKRSTDFHDRRVTENDATITFTRVLESLAITHIYGLNHRDFEPQDVIVVKERPT